MSQRDTFVRCAREQVGKRYVWATAGPNTFDCSGLVAYCHQQATGKAITRSSYEQIHLGENVSTQRDLISGDLVFWGNGRADHVGIYVGDNRVVNALNEQRGVVESDLYANYGMPYMGARRILPDDAVPEEESPKAKHQSRPRRVRRLVRQQEREERR